MNSSHEDTKESPKGKDFKNNIEVWEDLVSIKDLVISIIVCTAMALGGYLIAPNKPPRPLFFGLSGAIIGFVICTILIKPKRTFVETGQEE